MISLHIGIIRTEDAAQRQLSSYIVENPSPMHLCIFLILTCGISVGEAIGIKWSDVSVKTNSFRVHVSRGPLTNRKNKTRRVPFTERQRIYLRKMMGQSADPLFPIK
jgi:integrase